MIGPVFYFFDSLFAECFSLPSAFWHSAIAECPKKALVKEPFVDEIFVECSLSSVTLGKAFAECKIAFAECLRHSAKNAIPVVSPGLHSGRGTLHRFSPSTTILILVSITDHHQGLGNLSLTSFYPYYKHLGASNISLTPSDGSRVFSCPNQDKDLCFFFITHLDLGTHH
jgi:hypothetical protein